MCVDLDIVNKACVHKYYDFSIYAVSVSSASLWSSLATAYHSCRSPTERQLQTCVQNTERRSDIFLLMNSVSVTCDSQVCYCNDYLVVVFTTWCPLFLENLEKPGNSKWAE